MISMTLQSAQQLTQQLTDKWQKSGLALDPSTPTHFLSAVTGLALVIDNPDQTERIVEALLRQAQRENRSPAWIIHEIQFEAQAFQAGDRVDWLNERLTKGTVDDAALDSYNGRINRFDTGEPVMDS